MLNSAAGSVFSRFGREINALALCFLTLFCYSCAKVSDDPRIEELIKTLGPRFSGQTERTVIVPGSPYTVVGECDPVSKAIEISYDQTHWTTLASGCNAGTFSLDVAVNPIRHLYVRAKTKTGYTNVASLLLKLILPPTSTEVALAVSSRTDEGGDRGAVNSLPYFSTGDSSDSGSLRMHFNIVGTTHGL